ncbi:restriction endonuclease subunit S [Holdemanella biformis]
MPTGWDWCNVGNLFANSTGLSYKKDQLNKKSNSMIRVLRGGNIQDGNYIFKKDDIFISSEFVKQDLFLKKGYMITPAVTSLEHIGKIALIDKDYDNIVVGGFVLMLKPIFQYYIMLQYLLLFFSTNYHREACRKITHKSGQAFYNLSRDKLMKLYIAIPPLGEQKRIVDKFNKITKFLDL